MVRLRLGEPSRMGHRSIEGLSSNHGMATGGLYVIWFSDTHYYGGRAVDFRYRWARHLRYLKRGTHPNPHMQAVYNIHGRFDPQILLCQSAALNTDAEQTWLNANFGSPGCLNLSRSAHNNSTSPSDATRKKLSLANKGRKLPDSVRQAMSEAQLNRGWVISDEGRRKLSQASSKHRHSESARQKISAAHKGNPKSDATKLALVESNRRRKGEVRSEDVRRRISEVVKALVWVRNDAGVRRRLPPSELPEYLAQGWILGRGPRT